MDTPCLTGDVEEVSGSLLDIVAAAVMRQRRQRRLSGRTTELLQGRHIKPFAGRRGPELRPQAFDTVCEVIALLAHRRDQACQVVIGERDLLARQEGFVPDAHLPGLASVVKRRDITETMTPTASPLDHLLGGDQDPGFGWVWLSEGDCDVLFAVLPDQDPDIVDIIRQRLLADFVRNENAIRGDL